MSAIKTSEIAAFINTTPSSTATWERVKKQNELKINYEAEMEEFTFVDEDGPTNEVERYKVGFGGEHVAYKGDPVFEYLDGIRQSRATGAAAVTEVLIVNIYDETSGVYSAEKNSATITIAGDFGGEGGGGKAYINYSVAFNGDPIKGTCTITAGVPSFTAVS